MTTKNLVYFGKCKATTVSNLKPGMYQVRNYGITVKILNVESLTKKTSRVSFEGGQVLDLRNNRSIIAGWMDEKGNINFEEK